jgi:hypothetical protein
MGNSSSANYFMIATEDKYANISYRDLNGRCKKACSTGRAMDRQTFFKKVCRRELSDCSFIQNYLKACSEGPYETSATMSQCTGARNSGDKHSLRTLAIRHPTFPLKELDAYCNALCHHETSSAASATENFCGKL